MEIAQLTTHRSTHFDLPSNDPDTPEMHGAAVAVIVTNDNITPQTY